LKTPDGPDFGGGITVLRVAGRYTPEKKDPVSIVLLGVWAPENSERERKIHPPPEFDPRSDQLAASRYTNYAIPAYRITSITENAEGDCTEYMICYYIIYLLTAIGLTPSGNKTVRIYTQRILRSTQLTTRTTQLTKEQHN
jgi:hypothetical protein